MSAATRLLLASLALASMALADGMPAVPGLDAAVIARGFIPSSNNVHGEVRVVKREQGACVQTLLYSRQLRRGLFEMKKMERRAWPEGTLCHEDSTNYLAAMDQARDAVLGPAEASPDASNATGRLLIEFNLDADDASYTLSAIELEGPPEALNATQVRPISTRHAHPFYISYAMMLMAENGLKLHGLELEALLQKAGWKQVPPPQVPFSQQPVSR